MKNIFLETYGCEMDELGQDYWWSFGECSIYDVSTEGAIAPERQSLKGEQIVYATLSANASSAISSRFAGLIDVNWYM